jgi:hypothetical protein
MPNYNKSTRQRVADINLGLRVDKAANTTPLASADLFTVSGGRVKVNLLVGEVTSLIETAATTVQFVSNPTVGAAVNLTGNTTDLTAAAVGVQLGITGTAAGQVLLANALAPAQAAAVVVSAGKISVVYGAGSTGAIKYSLWYVPIDEGAYVEAA